MKYFSKDQADALECLLKKEDYREPGETDEVFEHRFNTISIAFLADVDEGIPRIKIAALLDEKRETSVAKDDLKRLKKAVDKLSDEAWLFIAEQIEDEWPETFDEFADVWARIKYAVGQKYKRPDKGDYSKWALCRLLESLNETYIIPQTSRGELVKTIASAAGIKAKPSAFRHCMDNNPPKHNFTHS